MYKNLLAIIPLLAQSALGAWSYDWSTRVDQYGKPAGIFTSTPFPLTESSTSYWITNDEGGVEYNLGTLYFVDGAKADDTGDGLSLANAKKTVDAAITAAGSGNKTILVRGAHDAFDGVYAEKNLTLTGHSGTDNTHRFMVCGYNQERPIFEGVSFTTGDGCFKAFPINFTTLQRLKIQNYPDRGVMYSTDAASSTGNALIDLWVYNCATQAYDGGTTSDGNIHYYAADNTYSMNTNWLYHIRSEHTLQKGMKISDHTHGSLIEWCWVNECGYWSGMSQMPGTGWHPYGIDCAADSAAQHNLNTTIRYNIVGQTLLGNEIRWGEGFVVHHNEFYDSVKKDQWPTHGGSWSGCASFFLMNPLGPGSIYGNVFRDNTDTTYPWLLSAASSVDMTGEVKVYNNLFYWGSSKDTHGTRLTDDGNAARVRKMSLYNNTFYVANGSSYAALYIDDALYGAAGGSYWNVANNLVYQTGAGSCISLSTGSNVARTNNLYYYPSGSRGYADPLEAGGIEADPQFVLVPSGAYSTTEGSIGSGSPARDAAADLSGTFTTDFLGTTRAAWDIGAYEYNGTSPSPGCTATVGTLRVR